MIAQSVTPLPVNRWFLKIRALAIFFLKEKASSLSAPPVKLPMPARKSSKITKTNRGRLGGWRRNFSTAARSFRACFPNSERGLSFNNGQRGSFTLGILGRLLIHPSLGETHQLATVFQEKFLAHVTTMSFHRFCAHL